MKKSVDRHACVQIMPPDANGDSLIKIKATEHQVLVIDDLCVEHQQAMQMLTDLLFEHQVADARKRMFKH